jgi:hypothetical protein
MPLKHKRLYMECLGISLHHRLCTDITSILVNKNLCTTNNHLKFICFKFFLLRLRQCWFFKGRHDYIKMVLSWQRSICETISVIFICCFCGLSGFDPRKRIIKPTRHNSVNPTHRELDRCQIIGYARLSGSNDTDVKFLQVTFCYRAYTWAAQLRIVNSNLDILLWCYLPKHSTLVVFWIMLFTDTFQPQAPTSGITIKINQKN